MAFREFASENFTLTNVARLSCATKDKILGETALTHTHTRTHAAHNVILSKLIANPKHDFFVALLL